VSAFAGFRFPAQVKVVAIRWYLRFNLSYRNVEELLVERGIKLDLVTVFRWVQRFTPLSADMARIARPGLLPGGLRSNADDVAGCEGLVQPALHEQMLWQGKGPASTEPPPAPPPTVIPTG
jgi:hypothetical protein